MAYPRLGRTLDEGLAVLIENAEENPKLTKFKDAVLEMATSVSEGLKRCELLSDRIEAWDLEASTAESECITAENKLQDMPNLKRLADTSRAESEARIKDLREQELNDHEDAAFFRDEISALEEELGLGSGWTEEQAQRRQDLEREWYSWRQQVNRKAKELAMLRNDLETGSIAVAKVDGQTAVYEEQTAQVRGSR